MRKVLLMAKRDFIESIQTKAFIIGLVVAPLLFGGGFLGIAVLKKRPDLRDKRIAVVDGTGKVAPVFLQLAEQKNARDAYDEKTHEQIAARYVFETVAAAQDPQMQRLALSDRVRRRELFAFLEIWPEALHPVLDAKPDAAPRVAYYTNAGGIDQTRAWLREPVGRALRTVQLAQLGVDRGHFEELLATAPIEPLDLLARDAATGAVAGEEERRDRGVRGAVWAGDAADDDRDDRRGADAVGVTEDRINGSSKCCWGWRPDGTMAARVLAVGAVADQLGVPFWRGAGVARMSMMGRFRSSCRGSSCIWWRM